MEIFNKKSLAKLKGKILVLPSFNLIGRFSLNQIESAEFSAFFTNRMRSKLRGLYN